MEVVKHNTFKGATPSTSMLQHYRGESAPSTMYLEAPDAAWWRSMAREFIDGKEVNQPMLASMVHYHMKDFHRKDLQPDEVFSRKNGLKWAKLKATVSVFKVSYVAFDGRGWHFLLSSPEFDLVAVDVRGERVYLDTMVKAQK